MSEQHYTEEQAKAILKRAVDLQTDTFAADFTHSQLEEMARDLGISTESLVRAEQAVRAEQTTRTEREAMDQELAAFERSRRGFFRHHMGLFLIINVFLFAMNVLTLLSGEGYLWFLWPLLGWGIGLASHWWWVQQKEGQLYEQQLEEWRGRQQRLPGGTPQLPG